VVNWISELLSTPIILQAPARLTEKPDFAALDKLRRLPGGLTEEGLYRTPFDIEQTAPQPN
jgi:hypothetical protein